MTTIGKHSRGSQVFVNPLEHFFFWREYINENQNQHYNGERRHQSGTQKCFDKRDQQFSIEFDIIKNMVEATQFPHRVVCFSLNSSRNTPGWLVMRKTSSFTTFCHCNILGQRFLTFQNQTLFPRSHSRISNQYPDEVFTG